MNIKTAILAFLCVITPAMNAGLSDWLTIPKPIRNHPYLAAAVATGAYYVFGSPAEQQSEEGDGSPVNRGQVLDPDTDRKAYSIIKSSINTKEAVAKAEFMKKLSVAIQLDTKNFEIKRKSTQPVSDGANIQLLCRNNQNICNKHGDRFKELYKDNRRYKSRIDHISLDDRINLACELQRRLQQA